MPVPTTRERLQQLIDEGGFTTAEDAPQLGVSRQQISFILRHELVRKTTALAKELPSSTGTGCRK
jgi:hypothetical protein